MANANIDQNDVKTWLAYNDTTGQLERVRVDPVLGYLEIFGVSPDANTPTALNHALIDQNEVKTLLAYNETSSQVESLRCDVSGNLLVIAQ